MVKLQRKREKSPLRTIWKGDIHSLLGLIAQCFWSCAKGKSDLKPCGGKTVSFYQDAKGRVSQDKVETDNHFSAGRVGNPADLFQGFIQLLGP